MSQLQKIIYLTRQQYETLLSNNNTGQVTYGGITLTGVQDNNIYFITDETVSATDLGDDFILPVNKGGTGKTSFTPNSIIGSGTSATGAFTNIAKATTIIDDATTIPTTQAVYNSTLLKSGGTMTGALNLANNTLNTSGDDAYFGDFNVAGHFCVKGKNGNTGIHFTTYNQNTNTTGGKITWDGTKFTITSTTPVVASINGNAATATTANALSNITSTDAASSTSTQRYVWFCYDNNTTGRPAYSSNLTFQSSTGTLSATVFNGSGASLTSLNGSNISSGTVAAARIDSAIARLASPALTGTPTAPTAADGTNTTQIATTAFVMSQFKYNDAMIYKGVVNSNNDLPTIHYQGWTYKVATAGTYAGIACEIGDMIICNTDGTAANNAHWNVIQTNIDGAVTSSSTDPVDNDIARFDGTTGRIIQKSGITIDDSKNLIIPQSIYFGGNTGNNGKAILAFSSTYTKYGIWYKDATNDIMSFSASGNSDSGTSADFAIEGGGKLYNKGNIIPYTDSDGSVGGTTTPVYVDSGQIKALSYTIAKSVPSDAKFTDHEYDGEKGITLSSGKFGHSNTAITAQTTQAVYPIKIDAYGHITAYGSAQTILSIGTGASNAAAGNHTHSTYVLKSGDTMTGALSIKASGSDANDSWLNFTDESSTVYRIGIRRPFATYGLQFKSGSTYYPIGYFSSEPSDGKIVIADGTKGKIKTSSYTIAKSVPSDAQFTDTTSFTITANATDGLWDLTGTNGTNAVTYALAPYSSKGTTATFYTAATNPTLTTRLNYDGYLYATKLYSGGTEVSVSGHTHSYLSSISWSGDTNLKLKQSVNGATATDVLQFVAGSNITLTGASGKLTIAGTANNAATHTVKTTTKYYVTGTETATTSTGGDTFDTGIYATTVAGQLNATSYKVNENVTLQYNSTDSALEFVFA